jgi:hypothetical protein
LVVKEGSVASNLRAGLEGCGQEEKQGEGGEGAGHDATGTFVAASPFILNIVSVTVHVTVTTRKRI